MKRTTLITGLTAFAVLGTVAMVQAKGGNGADHAARPGFSELDADGDGKIRAAELEAMRKARFDAMDTDSNGAISVEEFTSARDTARQKRIERMIERMDANSNGAIEFDELGAGREKRDGDMLGRIDTDKDGAISQEEYDTALANMTQHRGHRGGHKGRHHGGSHDDDQEFGHGAHDGQGKFLE